jgi:hypothetical protein
MSSCLLYVSDVAHAEADSGAARRVHADDSLAARSLRAVLAIDSSDKRPTSRLFDRDEVHVLERLLHCLG